jgi:hypothetical protein
MLENSGSPISDHQCGNVPGVRAFIDDLIAFLVADIYRPYGNGRATWMGRG